MHELQSLPSTEFQTPTVLSTHASISNLVVKSQSVEPENPTQSDSDTLDKDAEYPGAFRLFTVIVALVLSMLLAVMDLIILATAIPRIIDEFHSLEDLGWYAAVYFMTVAATQSTWGKAYKYFDLKTVFLLSIAVFEISSLICGESSLRELRKGTYLILVIYLGVAKNSVTLIVGRAICGIGAAGILAGCYIIVAFSVRPEKRPAFAGVLAATYGVGSSIAPVIGGALADRVSWRWW